MFIGLVGNEVSPLEKGPWLKNTLLVGSFSIEQRELADSTGVMRSEVSRSFWGGRLSSGRPLGSPPSRTRTG